MNYSINLKKYIVKTNYLFVMVIVTLFFICGCHQEEVEETRDVLASTSYPTYLSIDADLDNIEISSLSLVEEKIYIEARERFASVVDYKNQQFYLIHGDYKELNISESLFKHFERVMNRTNDEIEGLTKEQIGNVKVYSSITRNIRLKTRRGVEVSGGISGFERTFWGFKVYFSNNDLLYIAAGGDAVGLFASMIPDPTLSTKVATGLCGFVGLMATFTAISCPNGIVISVVYPVPVPRLCIPYDVNKQ